MDPDPSSIQFSLALALVPALIAALYATITAVMSSLSTARRSALIESLPETDRGSLLRYQRTPEKLEARWLWLRVFGVAATSALVTSAVPNMRYGWLIGLLGSIIAYAIPSELIRPFATKHAENLASPLLATLRPLEWLVAPISDPLVLLAQSLIGREPRPPSATLTGTEVEAIVNEGEQNGSLAHDQSEMIRNVLDFGDLTALDVMVPRIHVDAIDAALSLSDVLKIVEGSQHSRYPVYSDTIDNITGILHVKDLFSEVTAPTGTDKKVLDLARKPVAFVPETQTASTVLRDMRVGRHHMAAVVDEFGGFSGIVTLEDLLEEIVGDIQDEHDLEDEARIVELGDDRVLVDASLPLADVNRHLGTSLPEGDDYISLGGFLIDHIGRVPPVGTTHEIQEMFVTIREADRRHIGRVELSGLPPRPSIPPSSSQRSSGSSDASAA